MSSPQERYASCFFLCRPLTFHRLLPMTARVGRHQLTKWAWPRIEVSCREFLRHTHTHTPTIVTALWFLFVALAITVVLFTDFCIVVLNFLGCKRATTSCFIAFAAEKHQTSFPPPKNQDGLSQKLFYGVPFVLKTGTSLSLVLARHGY